MRQSDLPTSYIDWRGNEYPVIEICEDGQGEMFSGQIIQSGSVVNVRCSRESDWEWMQWVVVKKGNDVNE